MLQIVTDQNYRLNHKQQQKRKTEFRREAGVVRDYPGGSIAGNPKRARAGQKKRTLQVHHQSINGRVRGVQRSVLVADETLHLDGFRKEATMFSRGFELPVLCREAKSHNQQAKGHNRKEPGNFF